MPSLSLGYSPCPNDTFIFHALASGIVKSAGLAFDVTLADVETLNAWAIEAKLDVTKVSFGVIPYVLDNYCMLRAGGAMGRGCGPLIVAQKAATIDDLIGMRIAVPGVHTTAYLLMRLREPRLAERAVPMPFDRIMPAVRAGEVDAGLIIHEGRFTYPSYGLAEIEDLGRWWESATGKPIPLGAIIARRGIGASAIYNIDALVRRSLEHAFAHPDSPMPYVRCHAQELSDEVTRSHIGLYVNEFSLDMGAEGGGAIEALFAMAFERGLISRPSLPLFSA